MGKQVKQIRKQGYLPANVYGKGLNSKALQVKVGDFQEVYKQVGETGLVELKVGETVHPVLIKSLQMDYNANMPLHADFYQVNLKEKVKAMIPVELTGEASAVTEKIGVLLQTLAEVEIEALPDRIPESIEVSVEGLAEIGAGLTVGDLKAPEGVEILTDAGVTIAKIAEPAKEEEPVVAAEAPVEGEATAEGPTSEAGKEAKAEEKGEAKPQEKK